MGVAQKEDLTILYLLLKIGKINFELSIDKLQWVKYECTLKVVCHMVIWVIHRWLNHNLVTNLAKALQCERDSGHYTTDKANFIGFYLPAVTTRHPVLNCRFPPFTYIAIAQQFVAKTTTDCIYNEVWGFEVHVGYPHRQNLLCAENLLYIVILQAIGMLALYNFVKIIFHFVSVLVSLLFCLLSFDQSQGLHFSHSS